MPGSPVRQLQHRLLHTIARRGFTVKRHPAARRQRLLQAHRVDVVLDVGAARGGYASELRQHGYTGRIVSFEPLAAAHRDLMTATAGDDAWTTVNSALGDAPGRHEINIASNSDSSSLLPMTSAHQHADPTIGYVGTELIEVARLDDLAPELLGPDDRAFLKIDTQGFERSVLAGATETLPRLVGLQLELSFVPLYEGGMLADEAISFAYANGFHLVGLDQGLTDPSGAIVQADAVFFRSTAFKSTAFKSTAFKETDLRD